MNLQDIETGATVLVSYDSVYGGHSGFVADVVGVASTSGEWAGVGPGYVHIDMWTSEVDRQDRYDGDYANRRVRYRRTDDGGVDGYSLAVEAKNGGRWQRVSKAGDADVEVRLHGKSGGGFWDCFEHETRKRVAVNYDPTPRALDVVKGYECPCGLKHVVEVWNQGTDVEDPNFVGLKDDTDVEAFVADY